MDYSIVAIQWWSFNSIYCYTAHKSILNGQFPKEQNNYD